MLKVRVGDIITVSVKVENVFKVYEDKYAMVCVTPSGAHILIHESDLKPWRPVRRRMNEYKVKMQVEVTEYAENDAEAVDMAMSDLLTNVTVVGDAECELVEEGV